MNSNQNKLLLSGHDKLKRTFSLALIFIFSISLIGCKSFKDNGRTKEEESALFEEFCTQEFKDSLKNDSFSINFMLKNPKEYGIEPDELKIDNISEEYNKDAIKENTEVLNKLDDFDYDKLDDNQKITYDTLKEFLDNQIEMSKLPDYQSLFSPSKGIISSAPTSYIEYIIEDKKDAEDYIELEKKFKEYIDSALEYTKKQSEEGYFMTDYAIDKVVEQCNNFLKDNDNPFESSYNTKIDALNCITSEQKEGYKSLNKQVVDEYIIPSYKNVIETLTGFKGKCTNTGGLCNYKKGKDYYESIMKISTGTDKSMNKIIKQVEDNLEESIKVITQNSQNTANISNELKVQDNGPANIINYLKDNIKEYYPEIGKTDFSVDYQSKSLEVEGIIAYYMTSRIDDYNNNHIKINESAVTNNPELLYTTLAHESYPGHLYQHVYFCETNPNPIRFLTVNLGYAEGWAEYASDSSLDFLNIDKSLSEYIKSENFANSLLYTRMDIGINYEGWDLADLKKYLKKYSVDNDSIAESYYDSIVANPGIMLPYAIGKIEMMELKNHAQEKLKDKFDIKEFNKVILDTGNVPFDILKKQVEKYINENK